jgi:hypothetical protein
VRWVAPEPAARNVTCSEVGLVIMVVEEKGFLRRDMQT